MDIQKPFTQDSKTNPASAPVERVTDKTRRPFDSTERQLQVPEIPGYVMYWFADRPGRITRAQAAGWQFVDANEVNLANKSVASNTAQSGNTDLGSLVSVIGGAGVDGHGERLILMKIKREWWEKDQKVQADRSEQVAATMRGDGFGTEQEQGDDRQRRYKRGGLNNLFTRKVKKANV